MRGGKKEKDFPSGSRTRSHVRKKEKKEKDTRDDVVLDQVFREKKKKEKKKKAAQSRQGADLIRKKKTVRPL